MFFSFAKERLGFFLFGFTFFLASLSLLSVYLGYFGTDNEASLRGWKLITADSWESFYKKPDCLFWGKKKKWQNPRFVESKAPQQGLAWGGDKERPGAPSQAQVFPPITFCSLPRSHLWEQIWIWIFYYYYFFFLLKNWFHGCPKWAELWCINWCQAGDVYLFILAAAVPVVFSSSVLQDSLNVTNTSEVLMKQLHPHGLNMQSNTSSKGW